MRLFCVLLTVLFGSTVLGTTAQTEPVAATARPATACRPCHVAERPTAESAALADCTRPAAHTARPADEGPNTLLMNMAAEHYGQVVFPHKAHAEMSATGAGCAECHHEATEGRPMRKCGECHAATRQRNDLDLPDLRGAIHRQCIACHQRWDPSNRCGACHAARTDDAPAAARPAADTHSLAGSALCRMHNSLTCDACHRTSRSFQQGSLTCDACHAGWQKTFDHARTGLALDDTHREASCTDCHTDKMFSAPPSCAACHTDKTYPAALPGKKVPPPARRSPP